MKIYMRVMRTIQAIIIVSYIIILSAVAFTYINKYIYHKDYATVLDYSYFPIYDDGMSPIYKTGDIALIYTKDGTYNIGDIICYKYGNKYVVKKIDNIEGLKYTTKGNNDNLVHNINYGAIVGKAKFSLKSMYKIFKVMINPFVMVSILLFNFTNTYLHKTNKK